MKKIVTVITNNLIDRLTKQGFTHLTNQDKDNLDFILTELGQVIQETDVNVRVDSKALVTSDRELDYHTDHHKAKYIVWYCHKQTDKGGQSILMDAEKIWRQLSAEQQDELRNILLFEHKIFPDDKEYHPFVDTDKSGRNKFYYSFWLVNEQDQHNKALQHFHILMKQAEPIRIMLKSKDILIVDNHRIFHGRTAIEGSKDRYLKRYWLTNNNY